MIFFLFGGGGLGFAFSLGLWRFLRVVQGLGRGLKTRFPGSTLLPLLFGGLLIKAQYWEHGYAYY